MEFVDTNVFVRALTQDHSNHSPRSQAYLADIAAQRIEATTSEAVLVEMVQVLTSKTLYPLLSKQLVVDWLRAVIGLPGLTLPGRSVYARAIDLWEATNVDFVDTLNVAHAEALQVDIVTTFDRHYDRFPSVTRREP